jgi:hypothetical protein
MSYTQLVLLASVLSATSHAATDRTMNVRVDPLKIISGDIGADADFKVGDRFTIGPSVSSLSATVIFTELTGFNVGARGNWYMSGDALESSWYLGPNIGYSSMTVTEGGSEGSTGGLSMGTLVGYQWVWNNGMNLNLGGGANYNTAPDEVQAGNRTLTVPFYSGFKPQAEVSLGYAF